MNMNIQKMMQQAQAMQKKMASLQEESEKMEFEGQSGGGMVKISLNGKGALKKIFIDKSVINPEDSEIITDLIMAAYNDASKKCNDFNQNSMSDNFGGMLPPGFKFPF